MTDITLAPVNCIEATSLMQRLACRVRNWRARNKVRGMLGLDDRMLADIGVRRDEVQWAAYLPLSENAALSLEEAAFRRRRSLKVPRRRYR